MAETPAGGRKRAVPAARPRRAPAAKPVVAKPVTAKPVLGKRPAFELEDEPTTPNYALRLTENPEPDPAAPADTTFALRLSEALDAINAANGVSRPAAAPVAAAEHRSVGSVLAALDKLPPIRLPIGPAIPWKVGLPVLAVLVVLMGAMSRFGAAQTEEPGVSLPAYPVQTQAPLFAKPTVEPVAAPTQAQPDPNAPVQAPVAAPTLAPGVAQPAATAQPIGVAEPAGLGFDLVDIGIKLIAVLALAYGSLMLLKRFGNGGPSLRGGNTHQAGVRVISSIALAPNRSVHVIELPNGKTLLVGATPNSVNLLANLDDLPTE